MVTAPPVRVCSKCEYAAGLPCSTCGDLLCPEHIVFGEFYNVMCEACDDELLDKEEDEGDKDEDHVQAELDNLGAAGTVAVLTLFLAFVLFSAYVVYLLAFDTPAFVALMTSPLRLYVNACDMLSCTLLLDFETCWAGL